MRPRASLGVYQLPARGVTYSSVIPEDVREGRFRRPFGLGDKLEALRPVPGDPRFDSAGAFGRLDLPDWWLAVRPDSGPCESRIVALQYDGLTR